MHSFLGLLFFNFSFQCSSADISTKIKRENGLLDAVKISNPKTSEFQVHFMLFSNLF